MSKENFEDFLKKLEELKGGVLTSANIHPSFSNCTKLYKSTLGDPKDDKLVLILGIEEENGNKNFLLSFGGKADPFILTENEAFYMISAITGMLIKHLGSEGRDLNKEIDKKLESGDCKPSIGESVLNTSKKEISSKSPEELEEYLNKLTEMKSKISENSEEDIMSEEYEKIKQEIKDAEETFDSLSDSEKAELNSLMIKKSRELRFEKAKQLEKELLGAIEKEPDIVYDYAYFKNIYKNKGAETMREELAKIPKEERKDIIHKIVEEVKEETNAKENN